jgi:hypothetical protein
VIPFVGWLVGTVLVLVSRAWSSREKAVAVVLSLAGPLLAVLAGPDGGLGPLEAVVLLLVLGGGIPSALFLTWRLLSQRRAAR